MRLYDVDGMTCAACSARVEKAVSNVFGVEKCSVNLLSKTMSVEGTATDSDIIAAVEKAGYSANLNGQKRNTSKKDKSSEIKTRLLFSVIFTLVLMYFSMGHTMWGLWLPEFFHKNYLASGLVQLLLSGLVMIINNRFFINGFKGLLNKSPNMDTLVSMGSGASFLYSFYVMCTADGNPSYLHDLYFESSAMILSLITVGKMLEEKSKGKTTNAITSLMKLAPKTALILKDGIEVEIPSDELKKGDLFVVKPGGRIPADGVITDGKSAIDESALTGESIPVDKAEGDKVSAATINLSGHIVCRADNVGKDTTLSKIIEMVSEAAATKAPIAKIANKVSAVFVPSVIVISVITILIWLVSGESFGFALARGISVLVVSCPCALGLATPVAIMVGNGIGAKNGILFKTAESLEETGRVKTVVVDKTGTVTTGTPHVTDIYSQNKEELLKFAYSLELKSEHPLARAIIEYARLNNAGKVNTTDFKIFPGNGLECVVDNETVFGGKLSFAEKYCDINNDISEKTALYASEGKTPLIFGKGNRILGVVAVSDTIKQNSRQAIKELEDMGINVVMLTGDNTRTAQAVANNVGISNVISDVLPDEKEAHIRKLKETGKVIMVGDGINDAPALTVADIGIAIGAGTDIAIDAADVVLIKNSLVDIPAAIRLSRASLRNIKENLFWAFCYNIIGIPLAAGVFIPTMNIKLNPMFAAAAMSISSFLVITNALRLNFTKIYKTKEKKMKITIKIEGMMCPHCEARVKNELEKIDGVIEAVPSHINKNAVIELSKEISSDVLIKVIEAQGYKAEI